MISHASANPKITRRIPSGCGQIAIKNFCNPSHTTKAPAAKPIPQTGGILRRHTHSGGGGLALSPLLGAPDLLRRRGHEVLARLADPAGAREDHLGGGGGRGRRRRCGTSGTAALVETVDARSVEGTMSCLSFALPSLFSCSIPRFL